MYFTFYNNVTGKLIISRRMTQAQADARVAEHSEQSYLNQFVTDIDNKIVNLDTLQVETVTPPNIVPQWFKQRRNLLLSDSDWTQGADVPDTIKNAWISYRQSLRDITNGVTTVEQANNVTWPTKP